MSDFSYGCKLCYSGDGHWSLVGEAFADLYLSTYRVKLTQYEGQYEFWNNPMVMTVKICANNILYWGTDGFDDDGIRARLATTADTMEAFAMLAFSRAAQNLGDAAPGEDDRINPYEVSLDPSRWEADGRSIGAVFRWPRRGRPTRPGCRTCS